MNKKEDLRVIKTKNLIKESFLKLIEEKGYSKVTVTDIASKAMINRNTFYLHYVDKEDLVDKIIFDSFKEKEKNLINLITTHILSNFRNKDKLQELIIGDVVNFFLDEVYANRHFLKDSGLSNYINKLKDSIRKSLKDPFELFITHNVSFEFLFEGTFGVIAEWIKKDFVSKEQLIKQLTYILNYNWTLVFDNTNIFNVIEYIKNKNNNN